MEMIAETLETMQLQKMMNYPQSKNQKQNLDTRHTSSQITSKKTCPFDKCDGSGFLEIPYPSGLGYYREPCPCMLFAMDEQAKKDRIKIRTKFANIPSEFRDIRINDYKTSLYTGENQKLAQKARQMTKNYFLRFEAMRENGKGLYFYSREKGSGKTMLALALGNALINEKDVRVKFVTTVDLFAEIKRTYSRQSEYQESELLDCMKQIDVLILDDIGTEKQSDWVNEILYQVLNTRMTSNLVTIMTSNVHITQLKHDERIKSRIEKMCFPVQMPEESVRSKIAQQENDDLLAMLLTS